MRFYFGALCLFFFSFSAYAQQPMAGQLEKIESSDRTIGQLRYRCIAHGTSGELKIDITLTTATNFLEVELDNDVRVRGIASETLDRKNGTTHYFLQGGSAPFFQRLTLAIKDSGKWARFTKTHGADAFVCE